MYIHRQNRYQSSPSLLSSIPCVQLPFLRPMATLHLLRTRPLFSLGIGLGISSLFATQALYRQRPLLCEGPGATPLTTVSESFKTYSRDAKVPVFKDGRPNPAAYRQISAGSIIGMWSEGGWVYEEEGWGVVIQWGQCADGL